MIRIYENIDVREILNREIQSYTEYEDTVRRIVADVLANGDEAVLRYTRRFDCPSLEALEVPPEEIDAACRAVDDRFLAILREARDNIEAFHRHQLREGFRFEKEKGIVLGQKYSPIRRVGIYVPGGTAAYPSTVLMNTVPAKIAGVEEIIMTTPAGRDGKVAPEILAAARLCGVRRVFRCGGAQAIAALAYGTQSIPPVDKIVGPGNIFVALAKKLVFGKVSIDMIAGPSEILIIADASANPVHVAADLLSQAEHDKLAAAVLVTTSAQLAEAVRDELERRIPLLPRADIARASIDTVGKILLVPDIHAAIDVANAIAPEHLEVMVDDPFPLLPSIRNAGSVFLGKYTPEPVGDYFAGTNHTLPTGGSARFASPLSVDDFVKKTSYLYYSKEALAEARDKIANFAHREGLDAHAQSVLVRFEEES